MLDLKESVAALVELAGFNADKLRELLERLGRNDYDLLDVMLDLAWSVEPVMRRRRADEARERLEREGLSPERQRLAAAILGNYERSGVWTLSKAGYRDLLKQRYGALGDALRVLAFRDIPEALAVHAAIQRALFAA